MASPAGTGSKGTAGTASAWSRMASRITIPSCSFCRLLERRHVVAEQFQHFARRLDQIGAGAEDRLNARLAEHVVILSGDDSADDDLDVGAAEVAQPSDQLGDQGL